MLSLPQEKSRDEILLLIERCEPRGGWLSSAEGLHGRHPPNLSLCIVCHFVKAQ